MTYRIALLVSSLTLAFVAAGCSTEASSPGATLAAKVNGTAITVQGLGAGRPAALQKSLEQVIDRELLVQKALEAKLDRDPQVVQAVENARRQLLAQAWLDHAAARDAKAARDEIGEFYSQNPALFSQRRVYRFQEMLVSAPADKLDLVKAELSGAKDLDEVSGWLKWRNLRVSPVAGVTQAAEQLPLSYLPQLSRMKEGEIAVFASPLGATVIQLVHAQEAPLTQEQAAPVIEQFLAGRKRLELAATEVKRLREVASIEYVGEFKR
jgi:EpsD family peptidyl-prolyl cis-trans isomerase